MCLAVSVTGLAVADQASAGAPTLRTSTASAATVAPETAAPQTAQARRRERRRHNPHGVAYAHRTARHVRLHGTAKDPDRPHHQLTIALWRDGHRVRVIHTHRHKHHYGVWIKLHRGKNRVVVAARNIGRGTARTRLRVLHLRRSSWASHFSGKNKRIAAHMLHRHGWGHRQMSPLIKLWNRESGWCTHAANSSGAYGIPQALPGSKMSSAGPGWRHNAHTQIRWGLRYIAQRYGSPGNAWQHSQATGWY